jgi:hypothetical protein
MGQPHLAVVTDERGGRGASGLTIECVNPLAHGEEIKQLFLAHERPEFPDFFDRGYRDAVADGGTSWVGRDERGRLCAYIARFPSTFLFGDRIVRGGLLANVMVATAYRTFWPALALVRRVVNDSRQSASVDFLYTDPNESAASVLRAVGFRSVGVLRRFVLPLTDRRRSVDLGIWLYHLIGRVRARTTPLVVAEQRGSEAPEALDQAPTGATRSLRPVQGASLYRRRLAGYPSPNDCWYTFHSTGSQGVPVGRALVRRTDSHGLAMVCALQCEPMTLWSSVLVALAQRLREGGAARLEVYVMAESPAASDARRAGFSPREERIPVVALPLTALGAEVSAAGSDWRLQPVDLDR